MKAPHHRVAIIDGMPLVRSGLRSILSTCCNPDPPVFLEVACPRDLLAVRGGLKVDLVLSEAVFRGDESVFDLLRDPGFHELGIPVLVISGLDEQLLATRAIQAGCRGYVMKSASEVEIHDAVNTVLDGRIYLSRNMTARTLDRMSGRKPEPQCGNIASLTTRELEILEFVGNGVPSKEIADILHICLKTVETHRAHIREKLGLSGGSGLVCYASQWVAVEHTHA